MSFSFSVLSACPPSSLLIFIRVYLSKKKKEKKFKSNLLLQVLYELEEKAEMILEERGIC
jgi:hypothetical protein